jgi:hypothetical protein
VSSLCPVCNGLSSLEARCPHCGESLKDGGRADEYDGPYAPYREIDDLKRTNGYTDLANHTCVHLGQCDRCGHSAMFPVQEWTT